MRGRDWAVILKKMNVTVQTAFFMKRRVVAREEEEGRRRAGMRDGARAEGDGVWMESRSWTESRGVGLCARAMCGRDGDAND